MSTLALTSENVEQVLDELRPYLLADGGNVELVEIDGPIVKLRLQGACGSCPSSAMTLRMGIERRLREFILVIFRFPSRDHFPVAAHVPSPVCSCDCCWGRGGGGVWGHCLR
jgi:Fe-S cluster biogenesis protein NfuA